MMKKIIVVEISDSTINFFILRKYKVINLKVGFVLKVAFT